MEEYRLPKNPNVYITILVAFISTIMVGIFTFCNALIAEHEQGYTNSFLVMTLYLFLALGSTKLFSDHRLFFVLVAIWLFYRNMTFSYDIWPQGEHQEIRKRFNYVAAGLILLLSCSLCFDVENQIRTAITLSIIGIVSGIQLNPGNDDEEWAQTANVIIFCFLYLTAFFVRRFESDRTELVAIQSLWALQSNNFWFLMGGTILQLCVYSIVLFSHSKQHQQ